MQNYYVLVLVPQPGGGWRAHFPDLPNCRAEGDRVELAVHKAAGAATNLIHRLHQEGAAVPAPRSIEEIRADAKWAEERAVDWSKAIVSIVSVG